MGGVWGRITGQPPPPPEPQRVRVLVLGDQACGKTTFIDQLDDHMQGDATAVPTHGFHTGETLHMGAMMTLTELGGAFFSKTMQAPGKTPTPFTLAELMKRNDVVIYMVDTSLQLEELYGVKQRFMDVVARLHPDTPICLVFNERRHSNASRKTLMRMFQVYSLRVGGRKVCTLAMTYADPTPVTRMLTWTLLEAAAASDLRRSTGHPDSGCPQHSSDTT